jgi:glucose/arabinose dehydrogenase
VSKHRSALLVAAVALVLALAFSLGAGAAGGGREAAGAYGFRPLASGFTSPVDVTSAPGDASTLYVVEQAGTIQMVRDGKLAGTFLDIRNRVHTDGNELGLLSVVFSPGYAQNHLFYVDYTDLQEDTRVVELSAPNGVADPSSARELLYVDQPYPNHKGGQLLFDSHGLLYVGMGDGGTNPASGDTSTGDPENRAQSSGSLLGQLLRIDPTKPGATWQVVGMGLRNPWRFSFDSKTGDLWIGDVGAAQFEELDFRPKAKIGTLANYGWSRYEGSGVYNPKVAIRNKKQLVSPVVTYRHSDGSCAVIGGYVYRGASVPAARGRYFYGDLCTGTISSFRVGPKGPVSAVVRLPGKVASITSFGEDANGELYAVSSDGFLYALR